MNKKNLEMEFFDYLEEKNVKINNEKEIQKHFLKFIEERDIDLMETLDDDFDDDEYDKVYEYLEAAENASSDKEALKFAKKAFDIDPENWDAACMVADLSTKTPEKFLEKLETLIEQADAVMERDGWFSEENIGEFWGLYETRPYMRLRATYFDTLVKCGMLKKAIIQAEDILRLCENDNLGVRYRLMHMYAHFEDEEKALSLMKRYDGESTMFLLPLSILYYKLGNFKKATQYLKTLNQENKDTCKFFETLIKKGPEDLLDKINPYGYKPFTIQELAYEFGENTFLFGSSGAYINWGFNLLKALKKKKR